MILGIARVQVQVRGLENLDPGDAYVFAANHLSMFDIFAFLGRIPFDFRFVAKASLFHWPFVGWHLKRAGYIRVDLPAPPGGRCGLSGPRAARSVPASPWSSFPRGRGPGAKGSLPSNGEASCWSRQTGASIVPVTIVGSHRRLPRGSVLIQPGKMEMIIHEPIPRGRYHNLKLDALARQVRRTIVESYQQVS